MDKADLSTFSEYVMNSSITHFFSHNKSRRTFRSLFRIRFPYPRLFFFFRSMLHFTKYIMINKNLDDVIFFQPIKQQIYLIFRVSIIICRQSLSRGSIIYTLVCLQLVTIRSILNLLRYKL